MPRTKPRVAPFPHPGYRNASCVQLADGSVTTVDDADLESVTQHLWRRAAGRYAITERGKANYVYLHQLLTEGSVDRVDHANGDGLDNRRSNLRPATRSQNGANSKRRPPRTSGKTSKYRGVIWDPERSRWRAATTIDGKKMVFLGRFHDEEEAARAYDRFAIEQWGEFARPNFPQDNH